MYSAKRLCRSTISTYDQIIRELQNFIEIHQREIEVLLEYSRALAAKDRLAPAILFSYAVWGSTERSDRSLDLYTGATGEERIRLAGELALGIRRRRSDTVSYEFNDLDSYLPGPEEISDSAFNKRLLQVVQRTIRESILTYFTRIRDSFRHIHNLCLEFSQRELLYADDRFIKKLIEKISSQPTATENELWDIKETLEMFSTHGRKKRAAAIKFAERIAAFANHRGGIMLIGITNEAHDIVGVSDAEDKLKHIELVLQNHLDTHANFVRARALPLDTASTKSSLVVVVGQTDLPVGVLQEDGGVIYPIRVGPGTERMPREKISKRKQFFKGPSFSFVSELAEWVSDIT